MRERVSPELWDLLVRKQPDLTSAVAKELCSASLAPSSAKTYKLAQKILRNSATHVGECLYQHHNNFDLVRSSPS